MSAVIVGAGLAGLTTAAALREYGYGGEIVLLGDEPHPPYDRPPLSKAFLTGDADEQTLPLRSGAAWDALDLRFVRARVDAVDPAARSVRTGHEALRYDQLVWATGGAPRRFPGPGGDLRGVHHLRTLEDARALRTSLGSVTDAVVVGGGYIGLEVTAAMVGMGIRVTVLEAEARLLSRVTSEVVSSYYHRVHAAQGVDIRLATTATEFRGQGGALSGVLTSAGDVIAAQAVVVGIGLIPHVEPLRAAGAQCTNGVDTDASGRTTLPGIWAAGDCANHAGGFTSGRRVRLETVHNATQRARIVAASIAGVDLPQEEAPWGWSNQYDVKLKSTGLRGVDDRIIQRGDPREDRFSVLYLDGDRLTAIDAVNSVRDYAQARRLLQAGHRIATDRAGDPSTPLIDLVLS
ncbi:NAD(P)/FAD-dependent oxidoreductase [Microbacterium sp. MAHUQ-60]|uniref:NAD(P)/FAD-dependent oxidoreductase n=1 Tax=unclassified Microbacterium TaxID=2609290 RepID=UPI00360938F6